MLQSTNYNDSSKPAGSELAAVAGCLKGKECGINVSTYQQQLPDFKKLKIIPGVEHNNWELLNSYYMFD